MKVSKKLYSVRERRIRKDVIILIQYLLFSSYQFVYSFGKAEYFRHLEKFFATQFYCLAIEFF